MKAIQVLKTGGPEALTLVDIPVPKPKPAEAIVKILPPESISLTAISARGGIPRPCRL